nr:hypothetical protein Iba_chr13cCG15360 [Ipomoea batatas]
MRGKYVLSSLIVYENGDFFIFSPELSPPSPPASSSSSPPLSSQPHQSPPFSTPPTPSAPQPTASSSPAPPRWQSTLPQSPPLPSPAPPQSPATTRTPDALPIPSPPASSAVPIGGPTAPTATLQDDLRLHKHHRNLHRRFPRKKKKHPYDMDAAHPLPTMGGGQQYFNDYCAYRVAAISGVFTCRALNKSKLRMSITFTDGRRRDYTQLDLKGRICPSNKS